MADETPADTPATPEPPAPAPAHEEPDGWTRVLSKLDHLETLLTPPRESPPPTPPAATPEPRPLEVVTTPGPAASGESGEVPASAPPPPSRSRRRSLKLRPTKRR